MKAQSWHRPPNAIPRIDIEEFRETGYLQEANRRFFNPLGLALEVVVDEDGCEYLGGVWDYREDPEGIVFAEGVADPAKAERIDREWESRLAVREEMFGSVVQAVGPTSSNIEIDAALAALEDQETSTEKNGPGV